LLDGGQLRATITGILVDIFVGLYFLFQSLYGMQQLLPPRGYYWLSGCRDPSGRPPTPSLDECEAWRARVEPIFWIYLFITLVLG
jgi:hypothetical protein